MASLIRNPKDFYTGLLYVAIGLVGLYIAKDYDMGKPSKMGSGNFPIVLSGLLTLFGVIALVRSFIRPGESLGAFGWKACLHICGGVVLFGALLVPAGFIIALLALILASASGSAYFKFSWGSVLALVSLIAFCSVVFIKGLKVPIQLLGTWFGQ